jgi:hypothetical protein
MGRAVGGGRPVSKNETQVDPNALQALPFQIAGWMGRDVPLSDSLADATGCDAYVNRRYTRDDALQSASMFVACGTNVAEIMSHRPLGCYRGAGWKLIDERAVSLRLPDETELSCIIYQFYREGVTAEKVAVLHYCYADGQYFDEVMQVMAEGWRGLRTINFAAQVQIVASNRSMLDDSAVEPVSKLAVDSASVVAELFRRCEMDLSTEESGETSSHK